jgi:hypothetical protein
MEIKATLKPGQNGTKRLQEKYGDRLVCVRYRYDQQNGKRFTTVELVEEEVQWVMEGSVKPHAPPPANQQRLGIRVEYWETDLRSRIKAAGAVWRPRQKLWEMRYEDVIALGLEARVAADKSLASEA